MIRIIIILTILISFFLFIRYGSKCQFAHSETELRKVQHHPKYKTEICRTFWQNGTCPYGESCCFIHNSADNVKNSNKKEKSKGLSKYGSDPPLYSSYYFSDSSNSSANNNYDDEEEDEVLILPGLADKPLLFGELLNDDSISQRFDKTTRSQTRRRASMTSCKLEKSTASSMSALKEIKERSVSMSVNVKPGDRVINPSALASQQHRLAIFRNLNLNRE